MDDKNSHDHTKIIFVNKKELHVVEDHLTGKEILSRAGFDPNSYDLFLVHGQKSEKIESDQSVLIKNGEHFNAILRSVPYGDS